MNSLHSLLIICLFVCATFGHAQTDWEVGTVDTFYGYVESAFDAQYHPKINCEIQDSFLLFETMQQGCLMISAFSTGSDDRLNIMHGCYGIDEETYELKRVGGIAHSELASIKSHYGSIYTVFDSGEYDGPRGQNTQSTIVLHDSTFNLIDSISIREDQAFWDDRYPVTWGHTVYDGHEWGAGILDEDIYVFAIVNYYDSMEISYQPPVSINVIRQGIAAYRYDAELGNSTIVDILELDKNWDPTSEHIRPNRDLHHVNEIDVTPNDGLLELTFSNRALDNIYKIPFKVDAFGPVEYIVGNAFDTEDDYLPFIGNSMGGFQLNQQHGSELIPHPFWEDVDFLYSYNNGNINTSTVQQLSYFAAKITGDSTVEDIGSMGVFTSDSIPIYSRCCGGLEEVFRNNSQPVIALERGQSGIIDENGNFVLKRDDAQFEPMISLKIPPPFGGDRSWKSLVDFYQPNGFNLGSARNCTMTILYEDLPKSRLAPMEYWHEEGMTYVRHQGVYLWELNGNRIVKDQETIVLIGTLNENDLSGRLKGFIKDGLYMWPIKGGFEQSTPTAVLDAGSIAPGILLYPNPATDLIILESHVNADQPFMITSVAGKVVKEGMITSSSHLIDITDLLPGAYLMSTGKITLKFIKR